jgi:tetratricopeptide (TPR) repeat protein
MWINLTLSSVFLLWEIANGSSGQFPQINRNAGFPASSVQAILREASEIALEQDKDQNYWTSRVLQHIGELQIQARDFDSALRTFRGSNDSYKRDGGLAQLAKALAREGNRERALKVFRLIAFDNGRQRENLENAVQLQRIEHLIASGDLTGSGRAIVELKSAQNRSDALRKLAGAYAKTKDLARAAEKFALAVAASSELVDDFDREQSLWKTADAQLTVGMANAAKGTIRRLVKTIDLVKEPWARISALREAAVLTAKTKDDETSHRLFLQAIQAARAVDNRNRIEALKLIAAAQAEVGYIDDALNTASMINHRENDFTPDGVREEALYAIAVALLKANDVEGAMRTAQKVKVYAQYRDDALDKIVDHHIANGRGGQALEQFVGPDRCFQGSPNREPGHK